MVNNSTQPTILVKKADGTSVRMTMDELQAYKKTQAANTPAPAVVPILPTAPVQVSVPVKQIIEVKKEIIAPPQVQQIKQEIKPEIKKEEVKQPLETQNLKPKTPALPAGRYNLKPAPADEDEKMFEEKWEADDNTSLLDDTVVKANLPAVKPVGQYMPTNTTPVKDIFVDEAKAKAVEEKKKAIDNLLKFDTPRMKPEDLITKKPVAPVYMAPVVQTPPTKQIIQDVKPPEMVRQSVGPIDELENFSLVDFRRLEINTQAAGLKLMDKFDTLKHDSYLLFMDGVKAWYNSPLYKQYQDVLYQSLLRNRSVSEILMGGNNQKDLKLEEFKAILAVNESIN